MLKLRIISPTFAALGAAVFFGGSTPFAKQLIGQISPLLLAGLLYAGSGIGLILTRFIKDRGWHHSGLVKGDWIWLIGAISFGGILGPILLMFGLQQTSAATTSLLLNLEAVLTALLAWIVFKENTALRIVLGMLLIVVGGILLAWPHGKMADVNMLGPVFIACACFFGPLIIILRVKYQRVIHILLLELKDLLQVLLVQALLLDRSGDLEQNSGKIRAIPCLLA